MSSGERGSGIFKRVFLFELKLPAAFASLSPKTKIKKRLKKIKEKTGNECSLKREPWVFSLTKRVRESAHGDFLSWSFMENMG